MLVRVCKESQYSPDPVIVPLLAEELLHQLCYLRS